MPAYGLSEEMHARIAQEIFDAERNVEPIPLLSKSYPVVTIADAYAIQRAGLKLRLDDGAEVVGRKIGITSKGMMEMLECSSPDYGYLLAHTRIPDGGACQHQHFNAPIVEGELAFVLEKDLTEGPVDAEDVIAATERIVPCFEVCDTRFNSWKITVKDTIADNAGAARFMLGSSERTLVNIDPASIHMTMEKNGEVIGTSTGAEVMGSPVNAVVWLANKLLEYGDHLSAGDMVLSGAFMAADPAQAGDTYTVTMKGFLPLTLSFE